MDFLSDRFLRLIDRGFSKVGLRVTRQNYEIRHANSSNRELVDYCSNFSMTDKLALLGLIECIEYLEANDIRGAVVECGVWKGGSSMAAAKKLLRLNPEPKREIWMYDTFEGMTAPTERDVRIRDGLVVAESFCDERNKDLSAVDSLWWAKATLEEVRKNFNEMMYPQDLVRMIVGPVEQTLKCNRPGEIALLRLDTDWYESTWQELNYLFPLLSPGGVLIVDDYHYYKGSREAVDDYFKTRCMRPNFTRIGACTVVATF
jgi:O-methyltransferase